MDVRHVLQLIAALSPMALSQTPIISPGGVGNAADYATAQATRANQILTGLAGGSVVSIFGSNFAMVTQAASSVPLPTQISGTSVTVNGIPAPLFFVSPGQINFQMPSPWLQSIPSGAQSGIVVSTPAGASSPYLTAIDGVDAFGIFTADASGCGQGAVLNVDAAGNVSVNSPSNSASPGQYISIYGTGLGIVFNPPPDGSPAAVSPLSGRADPGGETLFDLKTTPVNSSWVGRAPGLIGVDQINVQVPATIREGCAVPLQVDSDDSSSQPVTIAIHTGGGPCVDPPAAGYGQITWEKTVTTRVDATGADSIVETETLTASMQASPGKQLPQAAMTSGNDQIFFGPSCPVPGYRSLSAGTVNVQRPGLSPVQASVVPLQNVPISGLTEYRVTLPSGTIEPGPFSVAAAGGADVGSFQSSVQIGSPIQITTPLAGMTLPYYNYALTINWTGGDSNSLVTLSLIHHEGSADRFSVVQARASDGVITMDPGGQPPSLGLVAGPNYEIVVEVTPATSEISPVSASGLSLGGQHTWKYSYRFENLSFQ